MKRKKKTLLAQPERLELPQGFPWPLISNQAPYQLGHGCVLHRYVGHKRCGKAPVSPSFVGTELERDAKATLTPGACGRTRTHKDFHPLSVFKTGQLPVTVRKHIVCGGGFTDLPLIHPKPRTGCIDGSIGFRFRPASTDGARCPALWH